MRKIKEFIMDHKYKVVGSFCGGFFYFMTIFPLTLDILFNLNYTFFHMWGLCGISSMLFLYFLIIGSFLGFVVENIIDDNKEK